MASVLLDVSVYEYVDKEKEKAPLKRGTLFDYDKALSIGDISEYQYQPAIF